MGKLIPDKYAATPQHKSNLRNIRGTFAAEGMTISKSTRSNLDRIASGQTSYQQVLTELQAKYWRHPSVSAAALTAPLSGEPWETAMPKPPLKGAGDRVSGGGVEVAQKSRDASHRGYILIFTDIVSWSAI